MDDSIPHESGYRRGLVLGFTAAEIMVLLLFLMLLIMGLVLADADSKIDTQLHTIDKLTTESDRWRSKYSVQKQESFQLSELVNDLQRELVEQQKKFEIQEEQIRTQSDSEIERLEANVKSLQQEIEKQNIDSARLNAGNEIKIQDSERKLSESDSKGQESACWYVEVPDNDGKMRERPLFLFDIKIADEFIHVVYPSSVTNRLLAKHKNPNFNSNEIHDIFTKMDFNPAILENYFMIEEFKPAFKNFFELGQNKQVRPGQKCAFNVAVWDHTSPNNKEGYKETYHQIVEKVFYPLPIMKDPWPH